MWSVRCAAATSAIADPAPAPTTSASASHERHDVRNSMRARVQTARNANPLVPTRRTVLAGWARSVGSGGATCVDHRPDGAVVAHVVPSPSHQHAKAVLETDQVVEVHREPHDPAEEPGELERTDNTDGGGAADGRKRSLVAVAERRNRLAGASGEDLARDVAPLLHRGRRHHRERLAVAVAPGGG